jgi:hypothetical protein
MIGGNSKLVLTCTHTCSHTHTHNTHLEKKERKRLTRQMGVGIKEIKTRNLGLALSFGPNRVVVDISADVDMRLDGRDFGM